MRVLVANVTQLRGEGLLDPGQVVLEDPPLLCQHSQEHSRVALVVGDRLAELGGVASLQQAHPVTTRVARRGRHPWRDEGQQPSANRSSPLPTRSLLLSVAIAIPSCLRRRRVATPSQSFSISSSMAVPSALLLIEVQSVGDRLQLPRGRASGSVQIAPRRAQTVEQQSGSCPPFAFADVVEQIGQFFHRV